MNLNGRHIQSGTVLICPHCREPQAVIVMDIWPDQSWDWRVIEPIKKEENPVVGISSCCNVRYITFEGLFYTEFGAI